MELNRACFQSLARFVIALIFFAAPAWAATAGQKVLYTFQGGNDGANSVSGLIFDASGNLYGTTSGGGGVADAGTVFELTPTSTGWSETVLYSFQGGVDGNEANTSLVMDGSGNLYGTTGFGGTGDCVPNGCGTVFELTPPMNGGTWVESIIYSFQGAADGAYPNGVILDKLGNLYGATSEGGNLAACSGQGCGTAFELSSVSGNWTETTLYSFQGGTQDGSTPASGLTLDNDGNLYGVTYNGGTHNLGTAYEVYQSNGGWSEKILYDFIGATSGFNPSSTLVFNGKGDLFGTAQGGNPNGCCGLVFALISGSKGDWTGGVAFRFSTEDGGASTGTLVFDGSGNLYGTSNRSGQYQSGTAYRLKPTKQGVKEVLYSFCSHTGCPNGSDPFAGLILDGSGNLYGTTFDGGLGYGVVYEITP